MPIPLSHCRVLYLRDFETCSPLSFCSSLACSIPAAADTLGMQHVLKARAKFLLITEELEGTLGDTPPFKKKWLHNQIIRYIPWLIKSLA